MANYHFESRLWNSEQYLRWSCRCDVKCRNFTCGTHTLCVSGGAQHSPANLHYSRAQICINLYLFYVADSSRCVVEANFLMQLWFFIFLGVSFGDFRQLFLRHLDVQSSWKLHRLRLHQSNQNVHFCFLQLYLLFFIILKNCHFPVHQNVEDAPKPRRGTRFRNIQQSASHH